MIHIRTTSLSIQVFHDEILLATFYSMNKAIEYSKITEQKLGLATITNPGSQP